MTIPRPWLGATGIALVLLVATSVAGQPERRGRAAPASDLEGAADAPVPAPSVLTILGGAEPFEAAWPDQPAESPSPSFESDYSRCSRSEACHVRGLCAEVDGRCRATSNQRCRQALVCKVGQCTAEDGECVVGSQGDCRRSNACRERGWCHADDGVCVPAGPRVDRDLEASRFGALDGLGRDASGDGCAASDECREEGRCESDGDDCIATSASDCAWSEECRDAGRCFLSRHDQRCYNGKRRRDGGMVILGSVMMGAGLIAGVAAIPTWEDGVECGGEWGLTCTSDSSHNEAAVTLVITGSVTLALGTAFLIYGLPKVPDSDAVLAAPIWRPEVRVGPASGSLRWRF